MEEQRQPRHLDVEGAASNQPVCTISIPGLRRRSWSQCDALWALAGTATALLLIAQVVLGDTTVPSSTVSSHTTAFTPGFLAPSLQRRSPIMHRPKLVTLSSSTVVESRPRLALQMLPDGINSDAYLDRIADRDRRGWPTLTAEDEERGYLAAVANGDFSTIAHQQDPRKRSKLVGFEAQAQQSFERGEAASPEEALCLMATRASHSRFDKYTATELSEICRKANLKAAQNLVDGGKASNLREAQTLRASNAANAMARKFVTNGEAATLEEAWSLKAAQLQEARLAKYGEMGLSEMGIRTSQAAAVAKGKYAKYPGVHRRKDTQRWRVQFTYRGKRVSVPGGFDDELEAALAHDAYVKEHRLIRPLHFQENDAQHVGGMPFETSTV